MKKYVILMMVIVLGGCTVSTPEPTPTATLTLVPTETPKPTAMVTSTPEPTATLTSTPPLTSTVDLDKAKRDAKAVYVKALNEGYKEFGIKNPSFKCGSVSWVDDEFKVVCKLTAELTREMALSLQYVLITQYAEAFAGTLREVAGTDLVVKIIFTMGQFDRQIMSTTLFSTLEKINNGRITEAVEWAQEAEIVEP